MLAHVDTQEGTVAILNSSNSIGNGQELFKRVKAISTKWKDYKRADIRVEAKQTDDVNCGVFVCYFIEQLCLNPTRQVIPRMRDGPNAYRRHIAQKLIEASAAIERVGNSQ